MWESWDLENTYFPSSSDTDVPVLKATPDTHPSSPIHSVVNNRTDVSTTSNAVSTQSGNAENKQFYETVSCETGLGTVVSNTIIVHYLPPPRLLGTDYRRVWDSGQWCKCCRSGNWCTRWSTSNGLLKRFKFKNETSTSKAISSHYCVRINRVVYSSKSRLYKK